MTTSYATLDDAPSCEYCVVLSGIDTPHWPITNLTRREKRKLHAAWHGDDLAGVQRIITEAMARGDYSWVAGEGCKVRDTLIPQERKWRPVPNETPVPLVRILAAVALVIFFLVILPTLIIVGQVKPEPEHVSQIEQPAPEISEEPTRGTIVPESMVSNRNWIANSSAVIACQMQPALCDMLKDYYNLAGFVARHDGTMRDCIASRMGDTDIDAAIEACLKEDTP